MKRQKYLENSLTERDANFAHEQDNLDLQFEHPLQTRMDQSEKFKLKGLNFFMINQNKLISMED